MSAIDMVIDLCDIMVHSNLQVRKIIKERGFSQSILSEHFKNTAKKNLKNIVNISSHRAVILMSQ